MKTLLLTALAFIGFAICAPQAEARDYGRTYSSRNYNHGYYRGRTAYSRAYYPYRSSYRYYRPSYYRSSYYYPRAHYYYGGGGCYSYPRYYSSYYGGCGYGGYYGYAPRLSLSFCF
jgi:hypothetical protein